MSDINIGAISASVLLDTSQLDAGLNAAQSVVEQVGTALKGVLEAALAGVEAKFGQVGTAAEGMAQQVMQSTNAATAQAERFNEQLAQTTAKLEALKGIDPLAELRQSFKGLVPDSELEKLAQLRTEITEVKVAEEQAASAGRDMERSLNQMATEGHARMQAAGAAAQMVGQQMSQAGHQIVSALGDATNTSMKFEEAMRDANSVMGMSEKEFQSMRKNLLDLSADPRVVDGPIKLAEGLYNVGSAGYSGNKALEIITESAKGAAAGLAKTGDVSKGVIAVLKSGIAGVSTAKQAVNGLVSEVQTGLARMPQIATGMARILPAAVRLKLTFQDVTAAQATLTSLGLPLAQANTALAASWNKIVSPTKAQADAMDQVGIKYGSAALKGRTYIQYLEDARTKMMAFAAAHNSITIGKSEFKISGYQDLYKRVMPYQQAEMGFNMLAEHTGLYKEKHQGSDNANKGQGASETALQEQLKAPGKALASLNAQVEALKIKVGDILGAALTPLLAWAQKAVTFFSNLPEPVQRFGVMLAAIAGVALTVGGAILAFAGNIALLIGALEGAGITLGSVAAILTGPVGLAIAAVTAIVAGLVLAWRNDWGQIREHTQAFIEWLTPYLSATWSGIKSGAIAVWGALAEWWKDNQGVMKATFMEAWSAVKDFLQRIWPPIKDIITLYWNASVAEIRIGMAVIRALFENTWGYIKEFLAGVWQLIVGIVKVAWAIVAGVITVGLDLLTGRWSKAWDDVKQYASLAWDGIKDIVSGAIKALVGSVAASGQMLYNAGKHMMQGLIDGIHSMIGNVSGAGRDASQAADQAVRAHADIHSPSRLFYGHGQNMAKGLADGITDGTAHVSKAGKAMAREAAKHAKQMARDAKEAADAIAAAYDHIFEMTHSEGDVKRRDADKQRKDRVDSGVSKPVADQEYALRKKEIDKEQAADEVKRGQAAIAHNNELTKAMLDGVAQRAAAATAATQKEDAERQKQLADNDAMFARVTAGFQKEADNQVEYEKETGKISLEQFRNILQEKLGHLKEFTDAWMTAWKKVQDANKAVDKQSNDALDQGMANLKARLKDESDEQARVAEDFQAKWGQAIQTTQGLLENGLLNAMHGQFKNLFSDILKGWIQMLEQMVAKAIAMGIINLLTGGAGGFAGGAGHGDGKSGFLGAFGFDDWDNDRHAKNWGFDFFSLFSSGMEQASTAHRGANLSGNHSSGQPIQVNHHWGGVTVREEADINKLSDAMAKRTQTMLRFHVGS